MVTGRGAHTGRWTIDHTTHTHPTSENITYDHRISHASIPTMRSGGVTVMDMTNFETMRTATWDKVCRAAKSGANL